MTTQHWLTERQSCRVLAEVGLGRRQALKVLAAGFAGEPVRTTAAKLYDEGRIAALAAQPMFDLASLGLPSLFIARRHVSVLRPRAEQLHVVQPGWQLGVWHAAFISLRIRRDGPIPLMVLVCGFVALGGGITAVRTRDGSSTLEVSDAGQWFTGLVGRRAPDGPGNSWTAVRCT